MKKPEPRMKYIGDDYDYPIPNTPQTQTLEQLFGETYEIGVPGHVGSIPRNMQEKILQAINATMIPRTEHERELAQADYLARKDELINLGLDEGNVNKYAKRIANLERPS